MKNLLLIVLLFTTIGFGWHFYGEIIKDRVDIEEVKNLPFLLGKDAIRVDDQEVGEVVLVRLLNMSQPSFVVLQEDGRGPGKVIGVSALLKSGSKRNLRIELSEKPAEGYIYASLYRDDGDGAFNLENDIPARGPNLAHVQTRFLFTSGAGVKQGEATETIPQQ